MLIIVKQRIALLNCSDKRLVVKLAGTLLFTNQGLEEGLNLSEHVDL